MLRVVLPVGVSLSSFICSLSDPAALPFTQNYITSTAPALVVAAVYPQGPTFGV